MSVSELDKTGFEVRFKFEKLIVGRNRRVYIRVRWHVLYCNL